MVNRIKRVYTYIFFIVHILCVKEKKNNIFLATTMTNIYVFRIHALVTACVYAQIRFLEYLEMLLIPRGSSGRRFPDSGGRGGGRSFNGNATINTKKNKCPRPRTGYRVLPRPRSHRRPHAYITAHNRAPGERVRRVSGGHLRRDGARNRFTQPFICSRYYCIIIIIIIYVHARFHAVADVCTTRPNNRR